MPPADPAPTSVAAPVPPMVRKRPWARHHGLGFLLEINRLAGILLHRERHCLDRIGRQRCAYPRSDNTAKQAPQRAAAIDCIHCRSPFWNVSL